MSVGIGGVFMKEEKQLSYFTDMLKGYPLKYSTYYKELYAHMAYWFIGNTFWGTKSL